MKTIIDLSNDAESDADSNDSVSVREVTRYSLILLNSTEIWLLLVRFWIRNRHSPFPNAIVLHSTPAIFL